MSRRRHLRNFAVILTLLSLAAACGGAAGGDAEGSAGDSTAAAETGEDTGAAEGYPDRAITWIVAFDPGGGSDTEFRRLQPHLEEALGVSLEVQYRPGAGGGVGWAELVNAEPDGYTIGGVVMPHIVLQPLAQDDTGFTTDQFAFITANVQAPQALVVSAENPAFEDFESWAAEAEANPGSLDIGASALYNLSHVIAAQLKEGGLEANYVSAGEGATEVITGVLGGHFPVGMLGANHAVGNDEIRAIAVSGDERYDALPDVPTFKELGIDVTGSTSWGVAAPPETPMEIRQVLADAILEALENPDVQTSMEEEGQEVLALGPDETASYVEDLTATYTEVVPLLEDYGQ